MKRSLCLWAWGSFKRSKWSKRSRRSRQGIFSLAAFFCWAERSEALQRPKGAAGLGACKGAPKGQTDFLAKRKRRAEQACEPSKGPAAEGGRPQKIKTEKGTKKNSSVSCELGPSYVDKKYGPPMRSFSLHKNKLCLA